MRPRLLMKRARSDNHAQSAVHKRQKQTPEDLMPTVETKLWYAEKPHYKASADYKQLRELTGYVPITQAELKTKVQLEL